MATAGDIRTQFQTEFRKAGASPLEDTVFFRWINRINKTLYRELYDMFPEKYISTVDITAIFEFTVSGVTGTYTVGETVTGSSSAATAVVTAFSGTTLTVDTVVGEFTTSDTITGGTSGATSTFVSQTEIFAHPLPSDFEDLRPVGTGTLIQLNDNDLEIDTYPVSEFGSRRKGFWLNDTDINIVPQNPLAVTLKFRYIPSISKIDSSDDTLIIPTRFEDETEEIILTFLEAMYDIREEREDVLIARHTQLMNIAARQFRNLFPVVRQRISTESDFRLLGVPRRSFRRRSAIVIT